MAITVTGITAAGAAATFDPIITAAIPAWVPSTSYPTPGQRVTHGGYLWSNKVAHTSGATFSGTTNWVQVAAAVAPSDGGTPASVTQMNAGDTATLASAKQLIVAGRPNVIRAHYRITLFTGSFTYGFRVRANEPSRRLLKIRNDGTTNLQTAWSTTIANNSDYNAPSAGQYTAGSTVTPGQEVSLLSTAPLFIRPVTSGQAGTFTVYVELGVL